MCSGIRGFRVVFPQRGGAKEEEGEGPRGAVLMAVACSPDRASEKLEWAVAAQRLPASPLPGGGCGCPTVGCTVSTCT